MLRPVGDDIEFTFFDGLGVHEFTDDAASARARFEEVADGVEVNAAGRNHFDLGERSLERFDVFGPAYVAAGEDLDGVGAGIPGGQHFGGGEGAGANHFG